jgi:uncharacterized protein
LEELRDSRGDDFAAGIVIHSGEQTLPFGDRIWAVPVSSLWSWKSPARNPLRSSEPGRQLGASQGAEVS